jgi:hypothetical protein
VHCDDAVVAIDRPVAAAGSLSETLPAATVPSQLIHRQADTQAGTEVAPPIAATPFHAPAAMVYHSAQTGTVQRAAANNARTDLVHSRAASHGIPVLRTASASSKPAAVDVAERVLPGTGFGSPINRFPDAVDRFIFRQSAEPSSAASSRIQAAATAPGSVPASPTWSAAAPSPSSASKLTDVEIRGLADKVYHMLVRRLASEKDRAGLNDGI